jgi:Raf kinase inhibitor-like YbhB/YbcL family protein
MAREKSSRRLATLLLLPAAVMLLSSCQASNADDELERTSRPEGMNGTAAPAATGESEVQAMKLSTPAFESERDIPRRHTCDGEDVSPALSWSDVPAGTQEFTLIMDDPDAPPGTWVHWVVYGIPTDQRGFPEGLSKSEKLDSGAIQGKCWGVDSFSRTGYHGPCPPPGAPHRYYFRLYALDEKLSLPAGASKNEVLAAMEGHLLAEAQLMGRYSR